MSAIHLVGSIPLENAEAVFRAVGGILGPLVSRVPDGETGSRANWIGWQRGVFAAQEALLPTSGRERDYQLAPPFHFAPGSGPDDLDFGALGFAREAIASFRRFEALRNEGVLAEGCRFQVSLPTPFAPVYSFVAYRDQGAVEPLYEARMLEELGRICDAVPAGDLAVQWDVATEMSIFERLFPAPFLGEDPEAGLIDRLARLGAAVPGDVPLGYHLCYGDMNHRHWKQPDDMAVLVRAASGIAAKTPRPIDWFHMPVPRDRDDDAYFAPLSGFDPGPAARLYLGLVHFTDGAAGARRRIEAARRVRAGFGIGTECGFGRRDPGTVAALLRLHAEAARLL